MARYELPAAVKRTSIDLSGLPVQASAEAVAELRECFRTAAASDALWSPTAPSGLPELREALAVALGCGADDVRITSGVRSSLPVLVGQLQQVVVETPSFADVPLNLAALGCTVQRMPWSEVLTTPGRGRGLWLTHPARNPDGACLPDYAFRSLENGGWAAVVVNEVYRWSVPATVPTPPAGWTMVGSLSKVFGPAARIGWIRGPAADLLPGTALRMAAPSTLVQSAWARFIEAGGLQRLAVCRAAESRAADRFREALPARTTVVPASGANVLLRLPPGWTVPPAIRALQHAGVLASPGAAFDVVAPAVRLTFANISEDAAVEAARRCAAALAIAGFSETPDPDIEPVHDLGGNR